MAILLSDQFRGDRRRGHALGPGSDGDPYRHGRDVERILSIDGGALRIAPPLVEGWGRTCVAYGPFANAPGLAFSMFLLNGHNTSQSEVMADTLKLRLKRWARGSGVVPVGRRMARWLASGRVQRVLRQFRWWSRIAAGSRAVIPLDENLAVGLYAVPVCNPVTEGTGFVMHADGPRNGELWTGSAGAWAPAVLGVQNVPIHFVGVVREQDVVLYISSLPGAHGAAAHPDMRPVAIVPRPAAPQLYAAVHQCLLGQIGFRADTRLYGVKVAALAQIGGDTAGAVAADSGLAGASFAGRVATVGGVWREAAGAWLLDTPAPVGLLRVRLEPRELSPAGIVLAWRALADGTRWELSVRPGSAELGRTLAGTRVTLAEIAWDSAPCEIQVLDDGREISVLAGVHLLFGTRFEVPEPPAGGAVGVVSGGACAPPGLRDLEVQPRALPIPDELVAGSPWLPRSGATLVADPLTGAAGDLAGRTPESGGSPWQRLMGSGRLEVTGADGARWRASVAEPLPGRTVYAVDWPESDFADLEVTLTPPGSARGEREHGTSGFCLWQDADNYLLINTWLDDCYGGASVSSFFNLDGFEDLYDAIWTNVGGLVTWGRPFRFRVVSDGLRYTVSVDGEPVLHRSLADVYPGCRPLRIHRVGLLGNWEWGADTGSRFRDFRATGRLR